MATAVAAWWQQLGGSAAAVVAAAAWRQWWQLGRGGQLGSGSGDGGGKINNNQLKAAAATVTETTTMTAMTTKMKMKATASLMAARHWRWKQAGGGESAAEAGSMINIFQTGIVCCLIECFNLKEPIIGYPPHTGLMCLSVLYRCVSVAANIVIDTTAPQTQTQCHRHSSSPCAASEMVTLCYLLFELYPNTKFNISNKVFRFGIKCLIVHTSELSIMKTNILGISTNYIHT